MTLSEAAGCGTSCNPIQRGRRRGDCCGLGALVMERRRRQLQVRPAVGPGCRRGSLQRAIGELLRVAALVSLPRKPVWPPAPRLPHRRALRFRLRRLGCRPARRPGSSSPRSAVLAVAPFCRPSGQVTPSNIFAFASVQLALMRRPGSGWPGSCPSRGAGRAGTWGRPRRAVPRRWGRLARPCSPSTTSRSPSDVLQADVRR